jgi:7-carboxy-7-deazaguanine synthase
LKRYLINEIYYAIHGEGVRYGIPHIFIRFSKCNLTCGFCDTEFESYLEMSLEEIIDECHRLTTIERLPRRNIKDSVSNGKDVDEHHTCRNVLLCGGEPLLQIDDDLIEAFKHNGWFICVETNGTKKIPQGIDWVTCSPKVAEHAIKPAKVNELKYTRGYKQGIPHPSCEADHYLLSPVFDGDNENKKNIEWCVKLCLDNPQWRLTVQHHKVHFGGIR